MHNRLNNALIHAKVNDVAMKTIKHEQDDVAVAEGFPTIKDEDRKHLATPATVDGFPRGWTVRRIPSGAGASVSTVFYSPIKKLRLTSKKDVHIFLDCLKRATGNEATASHYFMQDKAMNQTHNTRKRKICSHDLCNKNAVFEGKCRRHGPRCARYNCGLAIYARGHCKKHDPGPPDAKEKDTGSKKRKLSSQPKDDKNKKKSFPRSELFTRALSGGHAFTPINIGSSDLLRSEGGECKRRKYIQPVANKISNGKSSLYDTQDTKNKEEKSGGGRDTLKSINENPRPKQTSTGLGGVHIKFEPDSEDQVCDKNGGDKVQHKHKYVIADNVVSGSYINESKAAKKVIVKEKMMETHIAEIRGNASKPFDNKEKDTKVVLTNVMKARIVSYVSKEGEKGARAKHMKDGIEGFHESCKGMNAHVVLQDNLSSELQLKCIKDKKRYFLIDSARKEDLSESDSNAVKDTNGQKGTQSELVATLKSDVVNQTDRMVENKRKEERIKLNRYQAKKKAKFPIGCKVIVSLSDVYISIGVVTSVSISMRDGKLLYNIKKSPDTSTKNDMFMIAESLLAFAPMTPVYVQLSQNQARTKGKVLDPVRDSSEQQLLQYSVMATADNGEHTIYRNIKPEQISFRNEKVVSTGSSRDEESNHCQTSSTKDSSNNGKTDMVAVTPEKLPKLHKWRSTKVENGNEYNMIARDGRYWYWCDDCGGMYCMHKPGEAHKEWKKWQRRKEEGLMGAVSDSLDDVMMDDKNSIGPSKLKQGKDALSRDTSDEHNVHVVVVAKPRRDKRPKWRLTKIENDKGYNKIQRNMRTWYWCDDCGAYCTHKPGEGHEIWLERKMKRQQRGPKLKKQEVKASGLRSRWQKPTRHNL